MYILIDPVADLGGGGGGVRGVPFHPAFGSRSVFSRNHTCLTKLMQLQHQNLPGI